MNLKTCYFFLTKIDAYSLQRLARIFRKFLHLLLLVLLKIFLSQNYLFGPSGASNGSKSETVNQSNSSRVNDKSWMDSMNAGFCNYDFQNLTDEGLMRAHVPKGPSGMTRTFFLKVEEKCDSEVKEL